MYILHVPLYWWAIIAHLLTRHVALMRNEAQLAGASGEVFPFYLFLLFLIAASNCTHLFLEQPAARWLRRRAAVRVTAPAGVALSRFGAAATHSRK